MKDELFQQLAASLREGGAILRCKKKPTRSTTLQSPDAKAIREKLSITRCQFSALLGISPRTLQNWEQGHRQPEGTAILSHPGGMPAGVHLAVKCLLPQLAIRCDRARISWLWIGRKTSFVKSNESSI